MSDNVHAWPKPAGRADAPLPKPIVRPCDWGLKGAINNLEIQLGTFAFSAAAAVAKRLYASMEPVAEDALPEPVAYIHPRALARRDAAPHCITKPEYRSYSDAQAGLDYTPVFTADQMRAAIAAERKLRHYADMAAEAEARFADEARAELSTLRELLAACKTT